MTNRRNTGSSVLSVAGAFTVAFSAVIFMLILFNVIPGVCSFVSGLQLIFLTFLFIVGALILALGMILRRKERKLQANPRGNPTSNS